MSERRSQRLFERAAPSRRACLAHPFVRGLVDGTLPPATFSQWIVQDWHYLQTYIDALTALSRSAPTTEAAERWRSLAAFTRDEELALHRGLAADFGLAAADLERAPLGAATRSYTGFLRASVAEGYGEGVAAICPCGVGYLDLARHLASEPPSPEPRYAAWIAAYNDPAFADSVAFMTDELDAAPGDDGALEQVYLLGAGHELSFWQGLWEGGQRGADVRGATPR